MRFFQSIIASMLLMFTGSLVTHAAIRDSISEALAGEQDRSSRLVEKLTSGKADIIERFKVDDRLNGFVLSGQDEQKLIVYARKDGSLLFSGSLVDPNGEDIAQKHFEKYIAGPVSNDMLKEVAKLRGFTQGKNSAKHKAYVIMDPKCGYCRLQHSVLAPYIESGQLQVQWIMVGFIHKDSEAISAYVLSGHNEAEQVSRLKEVEEEKQFPKSENPHSLDPVVMAAFKDVKINTAYFNKYGSYFIGTPSILYYDESGKPRFHGGAVRAELFGDFLKKIGNQW